jgi:hypothetical protein
MELPAMLAYIKICLEPYCPALRNRYSEDLPRVLIIDNHGAHNNFPQPLDLRVFSLLKNMM